MDSTKLEELEKAYKKEKNHKVRARMVAVRMVRVRNMSVSETADIQGRCPNGFITCCAVTTKEASKASGISPKADGPGGFCEIPLTE